MSLPASIVIPKLILGIYQLAEELEGKELRIFVYLYAKAYNKKASKLNEFQIPDINDFTVELCERIENNEVLSLLGVK